MVTKPRQASMSCGLREPSFKTTLRPLVAALMLALWRSAFALPTDPSVVAGQAVVNAAGTTGLVINQSSGKAAIDWRTFNVGANESVRFNQPSAAAMTVNRVTSNDPSQILGQISAPGSVFLINPSGIIFGRSAVVDVGNLVATTLTASTADLLNGRNVFSVAPGGSGSVRNEGLISASPGGSVSLIGPRVVNTGTIATPGGTTGLVAGERVSVDFEGDGLVRYQVDAGAAQALVEHSGQIVADGGRVAIQASARDALLDTVLNVDGVVRARGVSVRNGEIYLDGGSRGTVQVSGTLDASGGAAQAAGGQIRVLGENVGLFGAARLDASGASGGGSVLIGGNYQGQGPEHNASRTFVGRDVSIAADAVIAGNGGKVIVWADDWTRFYGAVSARGGERAGDGGFVEVSGKHNLAFDGNVVTNAPVGKQGTLLLDPGDLYVGADPGSVPSSIEIIRGTTNNGTTTFATTTGDNYFVTGTKFSANTSYVLQASGTVTFNADVNFGSQGSNTVQVNGGLAIVSSDFTITTGTSPTNGGALILVAPAMTLGSINTNGGMLTIDNASSAGQAAGAVISGAGALTKQGAGILTLSKANDYTGGTLVNAGTVIVTQSLGLGRSNGAVTVAGGELLFDSAVSRSGDVTLTGGKLNINGKAVSLGTLSGTAGEVALGTGTAGTLTVAQGATGEFAGVISGVGNLIKDGTATLTLSNANTYSGTTTINGGTLSITNNAGLLGGTDVNVNSGGTLDIKDANLNALNLGLSGQGNAGAGALTGSGVARYAGGLTLDADAYIGGTGTLSLGGALQGVPSRQLTKVGTGTLVLESNSGSFRGDTTIASGTVSVRNDAALGTGAVTVSSGGALNIDGAILSATSLTLNGSGTPAGDGALTGSGAAGFTGPITLGSATTIGVGNAATLTLSDGIAGGATAGLTKAGVGTLVLNGAGTYSGGTTIQSGAVTAGNATALGTGATTVATGSTLNIDGVTLTSPATLSLGGSLIGVGSAAYNGAVSIASSTALIGTGPASSDALTLNSPLTGLGLTKVGAGTLSLSGANAYTGSTTINGGTLALNAGATLPASLPTTLAGGTTLRLNGTAQQIGDLTGGAGAQLELGATLTVTENGLTAFAGAISGPGNLIKDGSGTLTLSGANSYSGTTNINAGTLTVSGSGTLGADAAAVASGATLNLAGVTLTSPSTLNLSGSGVGGIGALTGTGTAGYNGAITLGGATTVGVGTLGDTLTLGGGIAGAGMALTKVGAGTLVLNGAGGYSGGTSIDAGVVRAGNATALGTGAAAVASGATLDLAGVTLTSPSTLSLSGSGVGGTGALTGSGTAGFTGPITLGSATTVNVGAASDELTLSGNITGGASAGLTKIGLGTLELSGNSAYSGGTAIQEGVLRALGNNSLGTGTAAIASPGTLELGIVTLSNPISLNGGALRATGNAVLTGSVGQTVNSTLSSSSSSASLSLQSTFLGGGHALTLNGPGQIGLVGGASGLASLSQAVGNRLDLGSDKSVVSSGAQTYGGVVTGTRTTLRSTGGASIIANNPSNDFVGLLSVTGGATTLRDANDLTVALTTGATTLTTGGSLNVSGSAASLDTTTGGALVFGTGGTAIAGNASLDAGGPVSQSGALDVGGDATLSAGSQPVTLADSTNRVGGLFKLTTTGNASIAGHFGDTILTANSIDISGDIKLTTDISKITSASAIALGNLNITGNGSIAIESQADMTGVVLPGIYVPNVAVQTAVGVPEKLQIYHASISQKPGTLIATDPGVTLNLNASGKGSIDLTAGATATSTVAGSTTTSSGLDGLIAEYARVGDEVRTLGHPGNLTNRIQGKLSAITQADGVQRPDTPKTVVAIASDTINVANNSTTTSTVPAINADTVMLIARTVTGNGGKIQTYVAATARSDGRNITTDPAGGASKDYSILPSFFVISETGRVSGSDSVSPYSFGSLGEPISISFGKVDPYVDNSLLQTIAVDPFRKEGDSGVVPIYLSTTLQPGVDPTGPIRRYLVYPTGTPKNAIRAVVVNGVRIDDSSAYDAVQSSVAEILNQVRKEQLESGFSNENVAAQLRKGVITETRVGQAAVNRFQGVAAARPCVGMVVGDMVVCVPSAGPGQQ